MSSEIRIAVIEDEPPIRKFLRASLGAEGYKIIEADTVREGIRIITQEKPELIILDLGLPDDDGLVVIKRVREWSSVPIIVLSAREQEKDKIIALDCGANDYLTKPFGVGELLARVRVCIRTAAAIGLSEGPELTTFALGAIQVDLLSRTVTKNDKTIKLTKIEFDLFRALIKNAGRVLTHKQLLKEVWGPNSVHEYHYVRIFVSNLRNKLEDNPTRPRHIITEQGVGYRLIT